MKQISDVGVSFSTDDQYSINWNFDGARYHIWPDGTYGQNNSTTLYKNPPRGTSHLDPGYFRTRRLDGTKPGNAKMIAAVMRVVNDHEMIAIAREKRQAEQNEANATNAENARLLEIAGATFKGIEEHLDWLGNKTGSYTLNPKQMRALIAYRDHHE